MKKSDLKTGMILVFENGSESIILTDTNCSTYKDVFVNISEEDTLKGNYGPIKNITEELVNSHNTCKIIKIYDKQSNAFPLKKGELLWEHPSEKICIVDGVEYSETTLINIIKKAHK
jgi:hypothetical protein